MEQVADARLELRRGAFERGGGGPVGWALARGVGNAPVDELRVRRELGTDLADAIAERDHHVEAIGDELVEVLGAVAADVDPASLHDAHRVRMQRLGIAAGAGRVDRARRTCARAAPPRSGIVRCCPCTGTTHAACVVNARAPGATGSSGASPSAGMQSAAGRLELALAGGEIDRVVAVAAVGGAATR